MTTLLKTAKFQIRKRSEEWYRYYKATKQFNSEQLLTYHIEREEQLGRVKKVGANCSLVSYQLLTLTGQLFKHCG